MDLLREEVGSEPSTNCRWWDFGSFHAASVAGGSYAYFVQRVGIKKVVERTSVERATDYVQIVSNR